MNDHKFDRLTHNEVLERLPAFVVGALDPEELLEIEEYIHAHPDLMARVHELELAAAKLAYAAPAQSLPKDLHARVMNRARDSLPPRMQNSSAPRTQRPQARSAKPVKRENWLAGWWRRRGIFDLGLVGAVAAALTLAVVYRGALGELDSLRRQVAQLEQQVSTIQVQNSDQQIENGRLQSDLEARQNQLDQLEQQIANIQVRNNELQIENGRLQSDLEMRQFQLASLAGSQQMVALGGTEAAPGASGRLYVQDTVGTLVLSNLDQLSADQIYQLWLIPLDGAPIPAGLLGLTGEVVELITLSLPTTLDDIAAVGVSVEPPGGSSSPTGPIVLLGEKA